MFRKINWVVFVLLIVIGLAAALPITGLYDHASCDWGPAPALAKAEPTTTMPLLSLSLRAPDVALAGALRPRLEAKLKEAGVKELVDNPLTWPRAQITVTEMEGRYTPFWASLRLKAHVTLDKKKDRGGSDVSADFAVEGSCKGLVSPETWQAGALELLAQELVAGLSP